MKLNFRCIVALVIVIAFTSCRSSPKSTLNDGLALHVSHELPGNPLLMAPITSSINTIQNTMSTLYGNDIAFSHAKTKGDTTYPEGAVLYEVTWQQKADSVWFGGNIPKEILSVERIIFHATNLPEYELYAGNPLRKTNSQNEVQRITFIRSQPMAVSP